MILLCLNYSNDSMAHTPLGNSMKFLFTCICCILNLKLPLKLGVECNLKYSHKWFAYETLQILFWFGGRRGLMDRVLSRRPGGARFESRLGQIDFWSQELSSWKSLFQTKMVRTLKSTWATDVGIRSQRCQAKAIQMI